MASEAGATRIGRVDWATEAWGIIEADGGPMLSAGIPLLFRKATIAKLAEKEMRRADEPERRVARVRLILELVR